MYAVIRTGGKQYRVAEEQRVTVERLPGDPGDTIKLDDVLMIAGNGDAPLVGAPVLEKAAVFAEVVAQTRGDKVIVFKKKRRQNYRRTKGHRQDLTMLRIASISASGKAPVAKKKASKAKPDEDAEAPAAEAAEVSASAVEPKAESAPETTPESTSPDSVSPESATKE